MCTIFRTIFGLLKHHRKRNPQFRAIAILEKIRGVILEQKCSKLEHLRINSYPSDLSSSFWGCKQVSII